MPRILLVEDNDDLAFGLRRALESHGHEVEVAGDGEGGLRSVRRHPPDLMVLDLMLPGMDGFAVLRAMRADGCDAPVLILSAKGDETDKVYGLGVGADDFVTKPFGLSELLARVEALLRRGGPSRAPGPIGFGDVTVHLDARIVRRAGVDVSLAPKEFDLLTAFLRRPGLVYARTALLRDVWGHAPDVHTRTVDVHVLELRRKLEAIPAAPRHFITVRKVGYRFEP
jgi:two-component system response regulator MtrA